MELDNPQWHLPNNPLPFSFPGANPRTPAQNRTLEDLKKSTPISMKEASLETSSHIRSIINPFVKKEVDAYTVSVPITTWIRGVTGIDASRFDSWVQRVRQRAWFDDKTIADALRSFCNATSETLRYAPFTKIANRILDIGRQELPEVGGAFPISDLKFFRNDPTYFQCYEKHGALGARRKPDVICVRDQDSGNLDMKNGKKAGMQWSQLLLFAEFKFDKTRELPLVLDVARKDRGFSVKQFERVRKLPAKATRANHTVRAGKKRMLADMDDEEANIPTSSKRLDSGTRKSKGPEPEVTVQAASYALEVLSCTNGTRVYSVGLIFRDDRLSLWYYDASGLVKSTEELSLIEDFEKVAAVLVALASCDATGWGAMPVLKPPPRKSFPENFPSTDLSGFTFEVATPPHEGGCTARIRLKDAIFCQYALVGRRTFVYSAETTTKSLKKTLGKVFVVKFSQQVESRTPENEIIAVATAAGVRHLPKTYFSSDLWQLRDGPRRIFHGEDNCDQLYDNRILRVLVCKKYTPLQVVLLKHPEYLPQMICEMLDCLHHLRYDANILHRDVSVNNIMCDFQDNGKPYFILNDFDLATVVTEQGEPRAATSNHRTGTLPFMAIELIQDMGLHQEYTISHRVRHDFESLYWSSLWCTSRIEPVTDSVLKSRIEEKTLLWEAGEFATIASNKYSLMQKGSYFDDFPLTPKFVSYRRLFDQWRCLFSMANAELELCEAKMRMGLLSDPLNRSVVLDKLITRDTIKRALKF